MLRKHPISVVVDNVRSIHNVGSIFRTSDAALVEKIYVTGISGTPENRAMHKTALGAQDTVAWEYVREASEIVRRLKGAGYTIAVLEITDTPTYPPELESEHFPLCLVVGNELFGVSDESIALADLALEIPQFGAKQSLNVSVAFGIAVFDVVRRYRSLHGLPLVPSRSEMEA
ncbi:MAG: TrmH family RNA methyltransferase [Rhodothermales bacterium]